ncbi:uncharacterized protein LOC131816709 [Mustela lutreola]|uniref:uncharacterized protein LOC131816707 n=1 Tax=Mustela lutreola TaxID=9666 RepID=UPI0027977A06|nr:uncharacterized protein LOC131816707 [Mustela lutreola]XP_059005631.1 uncharacterized protein LOC131816709 [Mustela lutreola]
MAGGLESHALGPGPQLSGWQFMSCWADLFPQALWRREWRGSRRRRRTHAEGTGARGRPPQSAVGRYWGPCVSLRAKSPRRSDAEAAGIVPFHGCHPGHPVVGSQPAGPWPEDTDASGAVASGEGVGVRAEEPSPSRRAEQRLSVREARPQAPKRGWSARSVLGAGRRKGTQSKIWPSRAPGSPQSGGRVSRPSTAAAPRPASRCGTRARRVAARGSGLEARGGGREGGAGPRRPRLLGPLKAGHADSERLLGEGESRPPGIRDFWLGGRRRKPPAQKRLGRYPLSPYHILGATCASERSWPKAYPPGSCGSPQLSVGQGKLGTVNVRYRPSRCP